jgi:hypothetical protein
MSKNPVAVSASLSAIETEAVMHFALIARTCGCGHGRFGALKIHQATDGHGDTKRVRIRTTFGNQPIEGVIVLKIEDEQWMLYCAASDIDFGDYHVAISYDRHSHTYHITAYFKSGAVESMDLNMMTGERKSFADPLDVGG